MMPLNEYVISKPKRSFLTPSSHERAAIKLKSFACFPSTVDYGILIWEWLTCSQAFPVYQGSIVTVARIGRSVSKMGRSAALFSK